MNELLPSFQDEEADSSEGGGHGGNDGLSNGHLRGAAAAPLFPEVDKLLALFNDSYKELVDLRKQVRFFYLFYFIFRTLGYEMLTLMKKRKEKVN